MERYTLDPAMPVLLRPDGAVQVGWDPRRGVLVHPPAGLTAAGLADLLRALQAGATLAGLQERFEVDAGDLVTSLIEAGVVSVAPERRRCPSVRVHGRGPLSDLVARGLRCSGARVTRSSITQAAPPGTTDLVVLADFLVAEPRVVRDLHTARVAHLPVRLRDGAGLVGPLVIPGVTSCLQCADLHRTDRDAAWPAVASQLRNVVGSADRATVLGTAALALNQVDRVIRAVRDGHAVAASAEPPPTLDTTLEFNVDAGAIVARRWSRHPRCWC